MRVKYEFHIVWYNFHVWHNNEAMNPQNANRINAANNSKRDTRLQSKCWWLWLLLNLFVVLTCFEPLIRPWWVAILTTWVECQDNNQAVLMSCLISFQLRTVADLSDGELLSWTNDSLTSLRPTYRFGCVARLSRSQVAELWFQLANSESVKLSMVLNWKVAKQLINTAVLLCWYSTHIVSIASHQVLISTFI